MATRSDLGAPAIVAPECLMRGPPATLLWRRDVFSIIPADRLMKVRAEAPDYVIRDGRLVACPTAPFSLADWFKPDVRHKFLVRA